MVKNSQKWYSHDPPSLTQSLSKQLGSHKKAHALLHECYYPLHASRTPPQSTNSRASKKIRINIGSRFQPINRPTRPISCGGLNQTKPQVLPGAHHLARLRIYFFCQPHVHLRSSVNPAAAIGGGIWGESRVLAALGDISCPYCPSGVCSASSMMYRFIGSDFSPFLHCIIA